MQLLGTGIQRSAKNARALVQGIAVAANKWGYTPKGDDLDTVNFESADETGRTFGEGIIGVETAEWNLDCAWDAGTNPNDDPPGLYPRDDLEDVEFLHNTFDTTAFIMPLARVRSCTNSAGVKDLVTFAASGQSQGMFIIPTGSVPAVSLPI